MKFNPKALPITSRALFTIVGGAVLINPVFAQEQASEELEEVVVTGLRGSLKASMETKRDAVGVVDAINAEDIGKFPDTNLSEALQRITGVSIDRRNGEGATVTARGFGPAFNMVTLNGRQMPAADTYGSGDGITGGIGGNTRSFNFANLAAESISAVEVYKTGRADVATGGIGASINVRTARPLDNDGLVLNLGAKAVSDTTNRVGEDLTPELSGIFSWASDDKKFGVGLSASYQKRDSGSSTATVNDWHIQPWNAANGGLNATNQTAAPLQVIGGVPTATIVNAPANGQLYGIPNDIRYAFSDSERERTNMQATVQFSPVDGLTLTADYTWAKVELLEDRGEQTIWLQRNGFDRLEFDTGNDVATPILLHEFTGASKDFGYEQQHREHKNDLNSVGFNASWDVAENFNLGFDFHDSRAGSHPDDGITGGSQTSFSLAGKVPSAGIGATPGCGRAQSGCTNFWTQTFQFNGGLPVASRTLFPTSTAAYAGTGGNSDYTFDTSSLGSQILRINYQEQNTDIKQSRIDGKFKFEGGSTFGFGVETRSMSTHLLSSGSNLTMGDWGVGDTGLVPDMVALLTPFSLTGAFDDFNPVGAPTGGWKGNANVLGQWALDHGYRNWTEASAPDGQLAYNPGFNTDSTVNEDTQAVYAQLALKFDVGSMASNLVVGARYEQTDVSSINSQLVPTGLLWQDDNDFQVVRPTVPTLVSGTGKYKNLLPNLDFDLALSESLKGRFSYSKTIARAGYGTLAAGQNAGTPGGSSINGFLPNGNQNNPGILPLESDNFDLSLEYYFSDTGYVSVGAFEKNVENFIGNSVQQINLFGITNQTGGPSAQAALAYLGSHGAQCGGQCGVDDSALFTATAMLLNPGTFTDANGTWTGGLANYTGSNAQHVAFATKYDILSTASDPLYTFNVSTPTNNKKAKIHGFEFGGQYFFGDSGFGVLANYTIVRGDIGYDVTSDPNVNQFALTGLSDSANGVLMYEKFGLSARLAYNWRDEFLSNINQGGFRNPIYVEAYDQIDLSVGYDVNDHIAVSFEAINLTGEDVRWHGRSVNQLWRLEDQGARYGLGARYKF
ncbi:MAG TPA: TonB-dependent receptor [Steroidobacteraceae bacterium]|jgi:TonB-dependent receptor|nr:TonB-dependent receptor [Steroidobacteraceae bacterium]